jgi:hypothetical protein
VVRTTARIEEEEFMNRGLLGAAIIAAFVAVVWGCSDDHDHDGNAHKSEFPSCQAVIDACHPLDTGEGAIHDCHEIAHDNATEEKCAAKKAECLATCTPSDADSGADASSADATEAGAAEADASADAAGE